MSPVASTIDSLKQLVAIVAALAVTNALIAIVPVGASPNLRDVNLQTLAIGGLALLNIVRFHHGNMRHLDAVYSGDSGPKTHGPGVLTGSQTAADFLVIFAESVVLVALSLFVDNLRSFSDLFVGILVIDVLWYVGTITATADDSEVQHQRRWTLNNVASMVALLVLLAIRQPTEPIISHPVIDVLYLIVIVINTSLDYYISWDFYFPTQAEAGE